MMFPEDRGLLHILLAVIVQVMTQFDSVAPEAEAFRNDAHSVDVFVGTNRATLLLFFTRLQVPCSLMDTVAPALIL